MNLQKIQLYLDNLQNGLRQVDVIITSVCNLNCKYCNALSPISSPWYINVSDFERNINRLSDLFNRKIRALHFVGGEPLLHKDLTDMIKSTRKCLPDTDIRIITNGLLLSQMSDSFYKVIQENKINIIVSKYPGIDVNCPVDYKTDVKKTFNRYIFDMNGRVNPKLSFSICPNVCNSLTLFDGKLYSPCIDPYIKFIKKYLKTDLPEDSGEDIYGYSSWKELLFNLFSKRPDACRLCVGYETDVPWSLSERDISEYTYE